VVVLGLGIGYLTYLTASGPLRAAGRWAAPRGPDGLFYGLE
jgi:hypothetical protein